MIPPVEMEQPCSFKAGILRVDMDLYIYFFEVLNHPYCSIKWWSVTKPVNKVRYKFFHMPEPMAPANTPEKSTENIQNTWQIKMYVVEFIQPKDLNII